MPGASVTNIPTPPVYGTDFGRPPGSDTVAKIGVPGPAAGSASPDYFSVLTASGAVAVPLVNTTFFITKAGVAALTLVDPTATIHDGVTLCFISATAQAHTLSNAAGSGFNAGGAASDVGTFGGAIGDGIVCTAYQGKWLVISKTNVTLA